MTPKHEQKQASKNWDFIKITNFCASKHTVNSINNHPLGYEEIFASYISDKYYYLECIKIFYNSTAEKMEENKNNKLRFKNVQRTRKDISLKKI